MQLLDRALRQFSPAACLLMSACAVAAPASAVTLGISKDGRYFTLDGKPTYLNGISYYSGTAVDDPKDLKQDLDDMVKYRFNWIRVWTHWSGDEAVTTATGEIREPYMSRLKTIITECNKRGMIVDVTMHRGKNPNPSNQAQHLACARTIAAELKPYRNVYIDVGNERDVGDARHVPIEEVGALIGAIKKIDPNRICTASATPGSQKDMEDFLTIGKQDFVAPHLGRDEGCSAKTLGTVTKMIGWMKAIGRRAPIHLQEPFRRGYTDYQPTVDDYYRDDTGAKIAEAAGWCLHNGSDRDRGNGRDPKRFRSFGLGKGRGRLFKQLDNQELLACHGIDSQIGGTDVHVLRYQAPYEEQLHHEAGRQGDRCTWVAAPERDKAGYLAVGEKADLPPGKHTLTWRLFTSSTRDDSEVVTLDVRAGDKELAKKTLRRGDWEERLSSIDLSLPFTTDSQGPIEFRAYWPGKCGVELSCVTLAIHGDK